MLWLRIVTYPKFISPQDLVFNGIFISRIEKLRKLVSI